jgi:transcriptional regulator with XRE-family HTH domain
VRVARQLRGLTQGTLAEQLGLTFQQVQKYETGANRVSASKLAAIAKIVQLPVSFFFAGYPGAKTEAAREQREQLVRPETIDLIRFYFAIPDPEVRQAFLAMVRVVAAAKPASGGLRRKTATDTEHRAKGPRVRRT